MAIATPSAAALALGRAAGQDVWEALRERPMVPIPVPTTAASVLVVQGPAILCGWAIREQAGAAAVWAIFDGQDANGYLAAAISLAANAQDRVGPNGEGPLCRTGIFLVRVSGTIQGAVWVKI